jgi:hypothetical protein
MRSFIFALFALAASIDALPAPELSVPQTLYGQPVYERDYFQQAHVKEYARAVAEAQKMGTTGMSKMGTLGVNHLGVSNLKKLVSTESWKRLSKNVRARPSPTWLFLAILCQTMEIRTS